MEVNCPLLAVKIIRYLVINNKYLGRHQRRWPEFLDSLPHMWKACMKILTPGFGLTQAWLLQLFKELNSQMKDVSLLLLFCSTFQNKFFQVKEKIIFKQICFDNNRYSSNHHFGVIPEGFGKGY